VPLACTAAVGVGASRDLAVAPRPGGGDARPADVLCGTLAASRVPREPTLARDAGLSSSRLLRPSLPPPERFSDTTVVATGAASRDAEVGLPSRLRRSPRASLLPPPPPPPPPPTGDMGIAMLTVSTGTLPSRLRRGGDVTGARRHRSQHTRA
jgi:hypothetical protein